MEMQLGNRRTYRELFYYLIDQAVAERQICFVGNTKNRITRFAPAKMVCRECPCFAVAANPRPLCGLGLGNHYLKYG